mgnify:CR=1 FL=1
MQNVSLKDQEKHPRWNAWSKLPAAVQAECRSFLRFIELERRGLVPGLLDAMEQEATEIMVRKTKESEDRALEKAIKNAPIDDPAKWEVMKEHVAGHAEYPNLT